MTAELYCRCQALQVTCPAHCGQSKYWREIPFRQSVSFCVVQM